MKKSHFIWLSLTLFSCIMGIFFYLIKQNILLIHWSSKPHSSAISHHKNTTLRKKVLLYFCKSETFEKSAIDILWSAYNHQENLLNLVGNWLSQLQDEKIISRYVTLESAAYSPVSHEVIISFSQSPLEQSWSIMKKWYCIESLSKTIKDTGMPVTSLIFLVNNHPMEDSHLDFSRPWPVDGFINHIS